MTNPAVQIYHCLKCGNVVHKPPTPEILRCCGAQMVFVGIETEHEGRRRQFVGTDAEKPVRQSS